MTASCSGRELPVRDAILQTSVEKTRKDLDESGVPLFAATRVQASASLVVAKSGPVRTIADHRLRVATDALGVMDGVAVAGFDGARQSEQHSLGRVEAPVQGPLVQEDLRANEELLRIERLAQEVVGARGDPAKAGLAVARRRENDDRDQTAYRMRLESLAHGDPVELWHVDVEQHEVGLLGGHRVERL